MYGIFNQKGFLFPFTLMICLLFSIILLHGIDRYVIEQQFFLEEVEAEKLKRLTQMGFHDIYEHLNDREDSLVNHVQESLSYPIGTVHYTLEPIENEFIQIFATCVTNRGRKRFFIATLNSKTKKIEKWVEE